MELQLDLLSDPSVGLDDDLVDFEWSFNGVGLVVDPFQLFQSSTLRLDTSYQYRLPTRRLDDLPKHVPKTWLDDIPSDEYVDVSITGLSAKDGEIMPMDVPNVTKGVWTCKRIDESECTDDDTTSSKTFCSGGSLEGLDGDNTL
jgi:hypothetical protein